MHFLCIKAAAGMILKQWQRNSMKTPNISMTKLLLKLKKRLKMRLCSSMTRLTLPRTLSVKMMVALTLLKC